MPADTGRCGRRGLLRFCAHGCSSTCIYCPAARAALHSLHPRPRHARTPENSRRRHVRLSAQRTGSLTLRVHPEAPPDHWVSCRRRQRAHFRSSCPACARQGSRCHRGSARSRRATVHVSDARRLLPPPQSPRLRASPARSKWFGRSRSQCSCAFQSIESRRLRRNTSSERIHPADMTPNEIPRLLV